LQRYLWPSNIRELQNVIERAAITTGNTVLHVDIHTMTGQAAHLHRTLAEVEREYIVQILEDFNWTIGGAAGAASVLGLHPNTLRSRMQKLGITRPQ
jgi:DNA-binding NtrC family response regulator